MVRLADFRAGRKATTRHRPKDYVSNAFPTDKKNTRYVSLVSVTPVKRGWKCVTLTKIRGQAARLHVQLIYPPKRFQGSFRTCDGLQADCDCGRYLYVWNYALNDAGLAVRDRTNGQPADETNPLAKLGACKHLVLVLRYLMRQNPQYPHVASEPDTPRGAMRLTTYRETP